MKRKHIEEIKQIGRPKKEVTKVRLNVRCTEEQKKYLLKLGGGKLQKGLDIVLEKAVKNENKN